MIIDPSPVKEFTSHLDLDVFARTIDRNNNLDSIYKFISQIAHLNPSAAKKLVMKLDIHRLEEKLNEYNRCNSLEVVSNFVELFLRNNKKIGRSLLKILAKKINKSEDLRKIVDSISLIKSIDISSAKELISYIDIEMLAEKIGKCNYMNEAKVCVSLILEVDPDAGRKLINL